MDTMTIVAKFALVACVAYLGYRVSTEPRRISKAAKDAKKEARRNIIAHLRANPRGLVLLDGVSLMGVTSKGGVTVLGDGCFISNCQFEVEDPFAP